MSLMMTVSQMTREGHHEVGGRAPATLAVNRGLFLGAPWPVEGHRRQWPSWPLIISYPGLVFLLSYSVQEQEIKTPYPRHCPDLHIFTMYAVKKYSFSGLFTRGCWPCLS